MKPRDRRLVGRINHQLRARGYAERVWRIRGNTGTATWASLDWRTMRIIKTGIDLNAVARALDVAA